MELKSKTIKRANGKCDITITFTTQQLLAISAKFESERTDRLE